MRHLNRNELILGFNVHGNTALMLYAVQKLREPISNKRTWKPMNIEVLNITLTFPDVCHI